MILVYLHVLLQVKEKSHEMEELAAAASDARELGEGALAEARRIEAQQQQRLAATQAQLASLRTGEDGLTLSFIHRSHIHSFSGKQGNS